MNFQILDGNTSSFARMEAQINDLESNLTMQIETTTDITSKKALYDILRSRFFIVENRKQVAALASATVDGQIQHLLRTSWDEGAISYDFLTSGGTVINLQTSWVRRRNGVAFPSEFSINGSGIIIDGLALVQEVTQQIPTLSLTGILNISENVEIGPGGLIQNWFPISPETTVLWSAPTAFDQSESPAFSLLVQQPGISDTLFFESIFGPGTSSHIEKLIVDIQSAGGNIAGALDYGPRNSFGDVTSVDPQAFTLETGRLVFGPRIAVGGTDNIDLDTYNLLLSPLASFNDRLLAKLPSTVLSSGQNVSVENFMERPHARIPIDLRQYNRPTLIPGVPFMNYCKVQNNVAGRSIFNISTAPLYSVWFLWNPLYSIWVFGPNSGTSNNLYWEGSSGSRSRHDTGLQSVFDRYLPPGAFGGPFGITGDLIESVARLATVTFPPIRSGTGAATSEPPDVVDTSIQGTCTLFISRTNISGPSNGFDSITFASLSGNTSSGYLTENPYPFVVNANTDTFLTLAQQNLTIPQSMFSLDPTDSGNIVTLPGNNQISNYGTIDLLNVSATGVISALFPPPFYLTFSAVASPEIQFLQTQINNLSTQINTFTQPLITGLIESSIQLGLADTLISNRIVFFDQVANETRLRLDGLESAFRQLSSAFGELSQSVNSSIIDSFNAIGSIGSVSDFQNFILTDGPALLTLAATFGGALGVFPVAPLLLPGALSLDIIAATLEPSRVGILTSGLSAVAVERISRSILLFAGGDTVGGMLESALGITILSTLVNNITLDVGANTGTVDAAGILAGLTIPNMPTELVNRAQPFDPAANGLLQLGIAANIESLELQSIAIRNALGALELELGLPPFNPDDISLVLM